ncbi:MAG: hypothetical protein ACK4VY_06590 [Brevundimonas sp.]
MSTPLQDKDAQWRQRRANGATPLFDPGMAPPGSDAEAGGAPAHIPHAPLTGDTRPPLPTAPDRNSPGLRLTPKVWFYAAGILAFVIAAAAWMSLT